MTYRSAVGAVSAVGPPPGDEESASRSAHSPEPIAAFVGEFFWNARVLGGPHSQGRGRSLESRLEQLDFELLDLRSDGTYVAKVEATLVNPGVRTFGHACMLPEEGVWSAYEVTGQMRIRVRPTTSRARVYVVRIERGELSLSRRGKRTLLLRSDRLTLGEGSELRVG
jgi:hypothetical protein